MRIGIDARELSGRATGVGRYLSGLLRAWAGDPHAQRHEFVLYAPEPPTLPLDGRRFPTRSVPGAPGTWWEQVRLPRVAREDRLDVFFAPAYTAPLLFSAPTVVTIHDVSYIAHPEWFRQQEGVRRRWLTRHTAARARAIITVSEFSRGEIVERLNVPRDRVRVIPQGIDPAVSQAATRTEPRVLFVGSIFNRRHVPDLVRAFASLARLHADASLDIVGDNRSYPYEDVNAVIDREQLGDRVRWHRYVSDAQLADLYARARAFAFLSEYEGLGMTPLEALAAGAPGVLLDTPVARESCGDAALYVGLGNLAPIAQALERLLYDEPTRTRLLSAAPGVLAKYSWTRAAHDTLAVLEQSAAPS